MSGNQNKTSTNNIVDLASSDEEDERINSRPPTVVGHLSVPPSSSSSSPLTKKNPSAFESFWKAGDYHVSTSNSKSTLEQGQLEHARVHPKFLHSNATSHKWAFGAIAELLDNAVDEVPKGATYVKLDRITNKKDHTPALLFQDNGGGMDPDSMRQCMSLGFSKKKGNTIGRYGNGFKTSTMRLGADVIVFSRTTHGSCATQSIGLLSYTFLRKTGQDDVIVPMVDFDLSGDSTKPIVYGSLDDWSNNLRIILEWSPFASEEELMLEFMDIGPHGTKIIVYNLWLNDDGLLELDFDSEEEDIRLRDEVNPEKSLRKTDRLIESHISYRIRFSLRAYASILYLRRFENFEIILRGKPVQQYNIVDDLKFTEVVMYRPQLGKTSKEVSVKAEIGFVKEAPLLRVAGFNVYHKNRLIRPFWKVTSDGNSTGNGVVGVLEANFIEPAHDKQDFERSVLFLRLEGRLKQMCVDFWRSHYYLIGNPSQSHVRHNSLKEGATQPFDENAQVASKRPIVGLSADMQQRMHLDQPLTGLETNLQCLSNGQTVRSTTRKKFAGVQPIIGLATDSQIQAKANCTSDPSEGNKHPGSSTLIDQISEENIQLFMRCEDHRQKEAALKLMIEEMERELAETKRKCSELASHLENQKRKQKG